MKNFKDFTENECIHCKTTEEAIAISKLLDKAGMITYSGISYTDKEFWREQEEGDLCIYLKEGLQSSVSYAELEGYTIYPASEFLLPTLPCKMYVWDYDEAEKKETIVLHILDEKADERYVCVTTYDVDNYLAGLKYDITAFKNAAPLPVKTITAKEATKMLAEFGIDVNIT